MSESIEELKTCKACGKEKSLSMFYFKKDRNDYSNKCNKCDAGGIKISKSKTHKKCKHCGVEKEFGNFHIAGGGKWLQPYCKECDKLRKIKYCEKNKDRLRLKYDKYYKDNRVIILNKEKIRREENPELFKKRRLERYILNPQAKKEADRRYNIKHNESQKIKKREYYYRTHDERIKKAKELRVSRTPVQILAKKEYDRLYKIKNAEKLKVTREKNKIKLREQKRIWSNKMSANNVQYRIKRNIRTRIRCALKKNNAYKIETSEKLLGCKIDFYKAYLEKLFTEGMTWERFMEGKIEIDHKKPCKLFDLTLNEQQLACFNYLNTQPLWAIDNMKKGSKYDRQDKRA